MITRSAAGRYKAVNCSSFRRQTEAELRMNASVSYISGELGSILSEALVGDH